jgi:hypothetical protein
VICRAVKIPVQGNKGGHSALFRGYKGSNSTLVTGKSAMSPFFAPRSLMQDAAPHDGDPGSTHCSASRSPISDSRVER